ncbi:pyridoxamine 5'-phosphate oxidase [Chromatiales bacterium (ex Bugula neritina AB1)]|nr:pyridoxamine 5'-phosphate oxidase [Chromatiales bacterium (ex Bugula neritina AB1)]
MNWIKSIEELERLYDAAVPTSLEKVAAQLTPLYRRWIEVSRFVVVSTVGPEGTDASPRGDIEPVVHIADAKTIWLPDWRGNNRIDTLRNIVRDGRISLMFMVPGCNNVVRINGRALLTADAETLAHFERKGKQPKTVTVISIDEIYFQCAKALMRSTLWSSDDESALVPSAGDFIKEFKAGFDGTAYDADYPESSKARMW